MHLEERALCNERFRLEILEISLLLHFVVLALEVSEHSLDANYLLGLLLNPWFLGFVQE